jgi:hypothetical protein
MPDKMGTMGSTQGVKDSRSPAPKKLATTAQKLPDLRIPAALEVSFSEVDSFCDAAPFGNIPAELYAGDGVGATICAAGAIV